jgi:hypothetical protein
VLLATQRLECTGWQVSLGSTRPAASVGRPCQKPPETAPRPAPASCDFYSAQSSGRWLARPRSSPVFGVSDLGNGTTCQWSVFPDRIADGHQGECEHVVRQPKNRADIILIQDVVGSDQRSQTKRPTCEDDVLHRRVAARPANLSSDGIDESRIALPPPPAIRRGVACRASSDRAPAAREHRPLWSQR